MYLSVLDNPVSPVRCFDRNHHMHMYDKMTSSLVTDGLALVAAALNHCIPERGPNCLIMRPIRFPILA